MKNTNYSMNTASLPQGINMISPNNFVSFQSQQNQMQGNGSSFANITNLSSSSEILNNQLTGTSSNSGTPVMPGTQGTPIIPGSGGVSGSAITPTDKIERCIKQVENKQKYNKNYYAERTKPKNIAKKEELNTLKEKCISYEQHINDLVKFIEQLKVNCNQLYADNLKLNTDNSKLSEDNNKLIQDNTQLHATVINLTSEKNSSN